MRFFARKEKEVTTKEKWCNGCKQMLPVSEFYADKYYADGHHNYCKSCAKVANKKSRHLAKYPEQPNKYEGDFGAVIKARRKELGMTQSQVADKAGCVIQTVLKAEYGKNIGMATAKQLLKALNLKITISEANEKH